MPIIDFEKSKQIEFGFGDICVSAGMIPDENGVLGTVIFREHEPRPIGEYIQHEENQTIELAETPVRFVFGKIESIDVVIAALEDAKKIMLAGNVEVVRRDVFIEKLKTIE